MSKEKFTSFFDNAYLLKTILYSLIPITVWIWAYIVIMNFSFVFYLSFFNIVSFILIAFYLIWSTEELVNSFIVAISLARIIDYVCKNDLLEKNNYIKL